MGALIKERIRQLGLSDTKVAHSLGMTQTRFAKYVTDRAEPDLATFKKICDLLHFEPNDLLNLNSATRDTQAHPKILEIGVRAQNLNEERLDELLAIAVLLDQRQSADNKETADSGTAS